MCEITDKRGKLRRNLHSQQKYQRCIKKIGHVEVSFVALH
jgi:hypothetical protein